MKNVLKLNMRTIKFSNIISSTKSYYSKDYLHFLKILYRRSFITELLILFEFIGQLDHSSRNPDIAE
jgi:hypothetical protein